MSNATNQLSSGGGQQSSSLGSALSAISSPIATALNYALGSEAAEKQNQRNIEQWNRENAYNHPVNQVNRLISAGLNPALMYQNGASGMVSAQSPEMTSAMPNLRGVDPLTAAQIANLNAQTKATEHSTQREDAKQPLTLSTMKQDLELLKQKVENSYVEWDEIVSRGSMYKSLGTYYANETLKSYKDWEFMEKTFESRVERFLNETAKGKSEAEIAEKQNEFMYSTLRMQLNHLQAQVDRLYNANKNEDKRTQAYADEVQGQLNQIEGQLERWDDMTTNERWQMGLDVFNNLLGVGKSLYSGSRVTETISTTKGGGKPSQTTSTFSRQRSSKN